MKKTIVLSLILALPLVLMQLPVSVISPLSVVCALEEEAPPEEESNAVININTASAEDLATLEGIGVKTAQNIVEYREANGPFDTIEDIQKVKGIGEKKFEKIRERLTVE